jgi:cytoskeletal protein CcmA (bactofilin family)
MSESIKHRRLLDHVGNSPAFLPEGSKIQGDFETEGALVLCGSIKGDGRVGGVLRMAADASWQGEIHCEDAMIAGRINGALVVAGKLEIGTTAVINADVSARSIAIARGAVVQGVVTVTTGEPVVEFEEKRQES